MCIVSASGDSKEATKSQSKWVIEHVHVCTPMPDIMLGLLCLGASGDVTFMLR